MKKRRTFIHFGQRLLISQFLVFASLFSIQRGFADVGMTGAAPKGNTFSFRIRGEPETLDWNLAHTLVETDLLVNLMEGLVTFDSDARVIPALAQSWTISEEGKKYTFKLRSDVFWSDGIRLKAQDFVYSWKRLLSRMSAASYAYILFDIVGAEAFNKGELTDFDKVGIKALDDLTFEVRLNQPVSYWINIPAFWVTFPVRQDIVERYGAGWSTPGRMVTLGPYTLEAHDFDSKFVMRAYPKYHGIPGNVDQINAFIVKDDGVALNLYENGKLDYLPDLSLGDLKKLAGRPDLKKFSQLKTGFISFVIDRYPVSNLKVRRAIAMAIDKSKMSTVLGGGQQGANSLIPPGMSGYSKEIGLPYDPAVAKKELASVGLDSSSSFLIEYITPDWDKSQVISQFIENELKKNLGLAIRLKPLDNKTYRTQLDLHASPIYDYSWTADYPDPDSFLSVFLSTSGNNFTNWKNSDFDSKVKTARVMQNPLERERIYLALQKRLIQDEALIVPLYYEPNLALVRPRVKNLELNSLGYLYLRRVNVGS